MVIKILLSVFILNIQPMTEFNGFFFIWGKVWLQTIIYITTEHERYEKKIKVSVKQLPDTFAI